MSLLSFIGPRPNILDLEGTSRRKRLEVRQPILTNDDLEKIRCIGHYEDRFDTKTIDFFWLLGFSAWRAIEVYSPALLVATWTGMPLDQALKIDAERGQYEFDYKQRVSTAQSLIAAEQTALENISREVADRIVTRVALTLREQK